MLIDGYTMQIYNEKEQLRKKNYKMKSLRKKGAPGRVTELNLVFKEIKRLEKSQMLGRAKGAVNSCQDTQINFQLVTKNFKKT